MDSPSIPFASLLDLMLVKLSCNVCFNDVPLLDIHLLSCGHTMCISCHNTITKGTPENGDVIYMNMYKCQTCFEYISDIPEAIKEFVKYVTISDNDVVAVCISCGKLFKQIESCGGNRNKKCHDCRAQYKQYTECPKCDVMIERVDGCDSCVCDNCKHCFCWGCCKSIPLYTYNEGYDCVRNGSGDDGGPYDMSMAPCDIDDTVPIIVCPSCKKEYPHNVSRTDIHTCSDCDINFCIGCSTIFELDDHYDYEYHQCIRRYTIDDKDDNELIHYDPDKGVCKNIDE